MNFMRQNTMNTIVNKPSQIVKSGVDSIRTFGRELSKPKQVARLRSYNRCGITVYMLDGDFFVYRAAR